MDKHAHRTHTPIKCSRMYLCVQTSSIQGDNPSENRGGGGKATLLNKLLVAIISGPIRGDATRERRGVLGRSLQRGASGRR